METATYKIILEEELETVTTELQGLGIHNPENPHDWIATPLGTEEGEPDENVAADRAEELEEREAVLADLELRYNNITRALDKIQAGAYGACEICNAEIEPERLTANPEARTCITHRDQEITVVH